MNCCKCKRDVSGLPVMRDNVTGLVCCEACGTLLGGPSGFIKYVESLGKPLISKGENIESPTSIVQKNASPKEIILALLGFVGIFLMAATPIVIIILFIKRCAPQ